MPYHQKGYYKQGVDYRLYYGKQFKKNVPLVDHSIRFKYAKRKADRRCDGHNIHKSYGKLYLLFCQLLTECQTGICGYRKSDYQHKYAEQGVYDKEHTVQLCHIVFVVRFLVSCIESCVRTAQTEAEQIEI